MVSFVLREVESSKIESLRKGAFSLAGKGVFLTHTCSLYTSIFNSDLECFIGLTIPGRSLFVRCLKPPGHKHLS